MTTLKLCGTTNTDDARLASEAGADFCGILVDVGWSARSLTLKQAQVVAEASSARPVILLCNPTVAFAVQVAKTLRPYALQLLCQEPPTLVTELKALLACEIWKTVHLPAVAGQSLPEAYMAAGVDALLVDSMDTSEGFLRMGGTGKVGDWAAVAGLRARLDIPLFLAGGIGPHNIAEAVRIVRPYGIDLCSGVEASRGRRDPEKVAHLLQNFRGAISRYQIA